MTTGLLLSTVRRRWYAAAVGLCLTVLAVLHVHATTGEYWTQVDVVFLAPQSERYPNSIEQTSASIIATAGLVATELNAGRHIAATSSAGTTLAGEGIREGHLLRVPNAGGQWAQGFDRPVVDVQVIGSDPVAVREELVALVSSVDDKLYEIQASDNTDPQDLITTTSAPREAQIFYLGGQPTRAAAVVGILGLAVSVLLACALDAMLAARRRRAARAYPDLRVSIAARNGVSRAS